MFKILSSRMIVPNMHLLAIKAPDVAREAQPGQFVIIRAEEEGERIPLSISDFDPQAGTVTVIFLNIGGTTARLAALESGSEIPTVVGPLGNATQIKKYGTVMCMGGCYGIGSMFPIARALKEAGNRIIMLVEARSSYLFYWEDRFKKIADRMVHITRDGSKGYRGHISKLPDIVKVLDEPIDKMFINGCTLFLKRGSEASQPLGISTTVSLNPIMIDGTGMCGVCRVSVGGSTKFACVDGPDFDGHQVDWAELLQRRRTYMREETVPLRTSRCEEHQLRRSQE